MKYTINFICLSWLSFNLNAQTHLVLSEIAMQPSAAEFIEIYNPTDSTVNLDHYYLTDHSNYYALPSNSYTVDAGDFIVKFPSGATIQPRKTLVIGFNGTDFITTYSVNPDYEIISQNTNIPDLVSIKTSGIPSITNAGESVILFYWDGAKDLVQDIDLLNVGIPAVGNQLKSKTGLALDGPDADALTSTYLTDANTMPNQTTAAGSGYSTKRILLEEGYETQTNGNGIGGHDETTENTALTWDQTFTAPTPGSTTLSKNASTQKITAIEPQITIYPNPANNIIHIKFLDFVTQKNEITIYNSQQQIVYHNESISDNINIDGLPEGLYFLKINNSIVKFLVSD